MFMKAKKFVPAVLTVTSFKSRDVITTSTDNTSSQNNSGYVPGNNETPFIPINH
ncbi:MAG: hypothetical protein IJT66_02945 [Clostridia bacterium]|nr:hypothetical protein [Clostridia bacterium]